MRPKQLINSSPNYEKEPDFPSLADEIAKPRPGMKIKIAAFTVGEKSINTLKYFLIFYYYYTVNHFIMVVSK